MNTYIALLRGINVGGKHPLPMQTLAALMERVGARNVRTYIQSGNAVFQAAEDIIPQLPRRLTAEIGRNQGFEPQVLVLGLDALDQAMAGNPFPEAAADPVSVHLGFLAAAPRNPDLKQLDRLKRESERFHLGDRVFYLHAPEGVGQSRLAAGAEKALGTPMTDRNWRTLCKLREMART